MGFPDGGGSAGSPFVPCIMNYYSTVSSSVNFNLVGNTGGQGLAIRRQNLMPLNLTFDQWRIEVLENVADTDSTIDFQINDVGQTLTVTILFGVNGIYTDLVNSDSPVIENFANIKVNWAGAGSFRIYSSCFRVRVD